MGIGSAINQAKTELPDDYEIIVSIRKGKILVDVHSPFGQLTAIPIENDQYSALVAMAIRAALYHAQKSANTPEILDDRHSRVGQG